jgi:hypothetical protein
MGANRVMLSAYWPVKLKITKVFSAHVTDLPSAVDQKFYRYYGGQFGLLSWRRGEWEDVIIADAAVPRTPSEAISSGLLRTEEGLICFAPPRLP